jgi:hypothetical protein
MKPQLGTSFRWGVRTALHIIPAEPSIPEEPSTCMYPDEHKMPLYLGEWAVHAAKMQGDGGSWRPNEVFQLGLSKLKGCSFGSLQDEDGRDSSNVP